MKKKILFVIPSLDAGGGEKSLVNLLGGIDLARFEVDVVLFHKTGLFLSMVPPGVNVTEIGGDYRIFSKGILHSLIGFLMKGSIGRAVARLRFALANSNAPNVSKAEQQSWKFVSQAIAPLEKKYDAAIAFLEKSSVYFVVDKVTANKKIGWIHTNYGNSGMQADFDEPYFAKLDAIVTVSDECAAALENAFPARREKIGVIHNIVSAQTIWKLAETGAAHEMKNGFNIVSVGRLSPEKGFDLAVETCARLAKKGIDANWYVIGEGRELPALTARIDELGLNGRFHLLGARANPYPYVCKASVYVQPSKYEGKSMAIDEAKILRKPIVVTNYATVKDQIRDGENGIISKMDPESLANAIIKITSDETLRDRLLENLESENLTTATEIEKFYRLL